MANVLNAYLQIKDNYSKEMNKFNNALKTNKSELKLVDEQLKVNGKDSEALANKQKLLAKETELLSNQQKATANMLRVSANELEKQANKCSLLEKELEDLEKVYKKNLDTLGAEDKLTKQSLKNYEKKRKELSSANKQYANLDKSVTNLNIKFNNLEASNIKASNKLARTTLEIQNMDKAVDKVDKSLDKLTKKDYTKIADGMMRAGAALGTTLIGIGTLGANETMQHEYGMAKIGSIVDVSQEDLEKLGKTVIETSNRFGIASKDIQESIYQALSSSVKFEDVQGVLEQSIKLSKGGFASLTPTLDVLTNIMNSYGKSASEVQSISDMLFQTTVVGKTTIEQLATQFSGLSVIAANTGVSLEQALSGLALLTQSGTSTSEAVTQIRALLNELGNDTTRVGQQVKKDLGMSFQDAMKNGTELDDVLNTLDKSAKASGGSLSTMLGSIEAKQAAMQIMADNGQKFDATLQQIANSAGSTQEAFDKVDDTKLATMEKSVQKLKNSMLSVGEAVSPYIDIVADGIEKIAEQISKTDANTVNLLATISAVTLGLGGTLKMTNAIGSELTTIKPLIAAVGIGFGQVALIGGGIAAVVGIFDALNTSLEEQNKKLEKAETNLANVKSEYDKLANNPNRTEAQEKILQGLEKEIELNEKILAQEKEKTIRNEVFGAGKVGTGELGNASGLQADIIYTKNTIKDLEEQYKNTSDQITKDLLTVELGKQYQNLATYTDEFNGKMQVLNGSIDVATGKERAQIDKLNEWADANIDLSDTVETVTEKVNAQNVQLEVQKTETQEITDKADTLAQKYIDVSSALDGYNKTGNISSETVADLITKYPDLADEISFVDGQYRINEESVRSLMEAERLGAQTSIDNQIAKTNATLEQARQRIGANNQEIASVKSVAEAYVLLGGIMAQAQQEAQSFIGDHKGYVYGSGGVTKETKQQLSNAAEMAGILKQIEDLQGASNNLGQAISSSGATSPKKSSSGNSKSDAEKKKREQEQAIKKYFTNAIDTILSESDELERTIEVTKQQIEMSQLKGDKETEDKLEKQLTELFVKKRDILHKQANELRELLAKTNDVEIKAKINSELVKLQDDFHKSKMDQYKLEKEAIEELKKAELDKVTSALELQEKLLDSKMRELEFDRILMVYDNTEEYLDSFEKEAKLIVERQNATERAIKDLLNQGYTEENQIIQDLTNDYYNYQKDIINIYKCIGDERKKLKQQSLSKDLDEAKAAQEAMKNLLNLTINMLKQKYSDEKDSIKELISLEEERIRKELDGIKNVADERKKALRKESSERDYKKDLDKKTKQISDTEKKILELQNDTSLTGTKKRKELEEQLKQYKEELDDMQYNREIELREESIDEQLKLEEEKLNSQLESFKKEKEAELKATEEYLKKDGNIRQEAMELIKNQNSDLYNELMEYNREYGDGVDQTITDAWTQATSALESFGDVGDSIYDVMSNIADKIKQITDELKTIDDTSWKDYVDEDDYSPDRVPDKPNNSTEKPSGNDWNKKKDENAKKMQKNSKDWFNASPEEKQRLAEENEQMAREIGAWKGSDGEWWIMVNGKRMKLYDSIGVYHTGGIVGGKATLNTTEEFAKLLKGEIVVTQPQAYKFMNKTLPSMIGNGRSSEGVSINAPLIELVIQGTPDEAIVKALREQTESISNMTLDRLNNIMFNRGHMIPIR